MLPAGTAAALLLGLPLGRKTGGTARLSGLVGVLNCLATWLSLLMRKIPLPWALLAGLRMKVLLLGCFLNSSTNKA